MNESNGKELLILAVVGMPATGKSEVIKSLKDKYNFFHLYYGDITFDEVKRLGLELNEQNERIAREGLRATGDMAIYSKLILPKIKKAISEGYKNILLESMYNIYEYEVIKDEYKDNFKVLAIHSDEEIRIKRINARKERKLTSIELESRQISEAKNLGKGTVISLANYHIINNGDTMEVFENKIKNFCDQIVYNKKAELSFKNYEDWNEVKKSTEIVSRILVNEGEVFWCRFGVNVGNEQDGKGSNFRRPVLILKKFSNEIFLGVPLTTKIKIGSWYENIASPDGKERMAILSQAKTMDVKRLEEHIFTLGAHSVKKILNEYINLLSGVRLNGK